MNITFWGDSRMVEDTAEGIEPDRALLIRVVERIARRRAGLFARLAR